MQLEKLLKPLGQDTIKSLTSAMSEDDLQSWLIRPRPTLNWKTPYDLLSNPTPIKIEQVRKVVQCLASFKSAGLPFAGLKK